MPSVQTEIFERRYFRFALYWLASFSIRLERERFRLTTVAPTATLLGFEMISLI
jgi:hypothetical protein